MRFSFHEPKTTSDSKSYFTGIMTISPAQTILVTDTNDRARKSQVAHQASKVRPVTTKAVSDITNTVLQEKAMRKHYATHPDITHMQEKEIFKQS